MTKMSSFKNTNGKNSVLLFLVWPFFSLVYALRNYQALWAKNIAWLFVVFFGITMTVTDEGEATKDANRYRDNFTALASKQLGFSEVTSTLYNEEDQKLDVIEPVLVFLLSRITDSYHILFAVFGLIFGFFYSRNIWYLIERCNGRIAPFNILLLASFAFVVGFWEINGFRFWCATHIFLFGALPYLFEGKRKYLLFSVLAGFMHFSYFLPVGVIAIYILAGNRTYLYFIMFIATFFVKELNITQVNELLTNNLPDIFQPKVKSYTNVDYVEGLSEGIAQVNWYVTMYTAALKWSVIVFLAAIFFIGKNLWAGNKHFNNLFSFSLLMYSFANILSLLPSGGRFLLLANLFALAFIVLYVQYARPHKIFHRITQMAVPALLLFIIVSVRAAFDTMGVFSVLGNPIITVFTDFNVTLIDVIKGLL